MPAGGAVLPLRRAVSGDEDGLRLDVLLARWLHEPRACAQRHVADGAVTVDGAAAVKSHRVRIGEVIGVAAPPPSVAEAPPPAVPVRWEDEHLAVVAKPAGLLVHAGAGRREATLVDALRAAGMPLAATGEDDRPGIVHRLDRGTSGLMVVAKSAEAAAGLVRAFQAHDLERRYWALVDGVPDPAAATIDAPIARSPAARTRFRVDPAGRRAVSHYDVEEAFGRAAALDVCLETGRTHQVRVHLSAVGHPVCGDVAYGASPVLSRDLGLAGPALHARLLGFAHPVTGAAIEVAEPLPAVLRAALDRLRAQRG